MELKQFAEELRLKMNAEIDSISVDQPDALIRTSQIITTIERDLLQLQHFLQKYKLKTAAEEIAFFKTIKPHFISALWYHQHLFKIQLFEAYNTNDARLKYYRKQLSILEAFMSKNQEFYRYILSNAVHLDEKYFMRVPAKRRAGIDEKSSTPQDIFLSNILCNEQLKGYLIKAIQKIELPISTPVNSALTWTGSKTDLIELIYALQAVGVFNKESADVKQIATHFEIVFNVTLGNYYRVFQEIRIRKTGQVNFINQLKDGLLERIRDSDA
jgi:hypothetical protein